MDNPPCFGAIDMGRFMETVSYAGRLLRDQGGYFHIIVGALGLLAGLAGKQARASRLKTMGRKQAFAELTFQAAQEKADQERTAQELAAIKTAHRSKIEYLQLWRKAQKEAGFQRGMYSGPLFQAVRK